MTSCVFLPMLLLLSVAGFSISDFVPVPTGMRTPVLPIFYNFSLGSSENMVCVTLPLTRLADLVLRPINSNDGIFRVEDGGEFTQTDEVCFFNQALCLVHIESSGSEPDRLVIITTDTPIGFAGTLQIQYIPETSGIPFNLTVDFGPPDISFDRSTASLDSFGQDDSLFFRQRSITTTFVCEILENGEPGCQQENGCIVSSVFVALIAEAVDSCIQPSGIVELLERQVKLGGAVEPGLRRLVMIEGQSCMNNPPRMSEVINVTVVQRVTTPPVNGTTPTSTSIASSEPPATDAFPLTIIIVICVCVVAGLVLGGIVIVAVLIVIIKRRQKKQDLAEAIKLPELPSEAEGDSKTHRETNHYVSFNIGDPVEPTPTEFSAAEVTGIIFVSNDSTQSYKELEDELLYQHRCDRIQPVAGPPGHTPNWNSTWRGIASHLKEETCLVYVIWSGSLETASGTHDPPIRQVIQSLERPLHKNTAERESVNHRLILLQLGSKGTVDHLATDLYTKVFWKDLAEDSGFNSKECASFVCKTVNDIIFEKESQIRNNKSNLGKTEIDGQTKAALMVGKGFDNSDKHISDSSDNKPVTETQLKEHLSSLFGKIAKKEDEVIKNVHDVGRAVEHVDEKLDEHIILPEEELQPGPSESYA